MSYFIYKREIQWNNLKPEWIYRGMILEVDEPKSNQIIPQLKYFTTPSFISEEDLCGLELLISTKSR